MKLKYYIVFFMLSSAIFCAHSQNEDQRIFNIVQDFLLNNNCVSVQKNGILPPIQQSVIFDDRFNRIIEKIEGDLRLENTRLNQSKKYSDTLIVNGQRYHVILYKFNSRKISNNDDFKRDIKIWKISISYTFGHDLVKIYNLLYTDKLGTYAPFTLNGMPAHNPASVPYTPSHSSAQIMPPPNDPFDVEQLLAMSPLFSDEQSMHAEEQDISVSVPVPTPAPNYEVKVEEGKAYIRSILQKINKLMNEGNPLAHMSALYEGLLKVADQETIDWLYTILDTYNILLDKTERMFNVNGSQGDVRAASLIEFTSLASSEVDIRIKFCILTIDGRERYLYIQQFSINDRPLVFFNN